MTFRFLTNDVQVTAKPVKLRSVGKRPILVNSIILVKGKIDKGEKPEQAALREVWEECGLTDLKINRAIAPSYHTYWMKGKRILKLSHWFEMKIPDFQIPTLQTEEDIEDAVWIPISGFQPYRPISYPSIVDVVDSFNS